MPDTEKIHSFRDGTVEDERYLTIETTYPGRCVVDLTPMREDGDTAEYRLPCKVQALRDVLEGRLRHLQSQSAYGTFERDGDFVWISFHRAEPTKICIRAVDLETLLAKLHSDPNP